MNDAGWTRLQRAALVFATAVALHTADHLRRGLGAVAVPVQVAGNTQLVVGAVAVVLVFRRHRGAPELAAAIGIASAVGFAAAHLLPHWSSFSDAFAGSRRGPHVTWFSWVTALVEIAADAWFGWEGLRAWRLTHPAPVGRR